MARERRGAPASRQAACPSEFAGRSSSGRDLANAPGGRDPIVPADGAHADARPPPAASATAREAAAAAEEALNDIKAHEVGMVTGMEAALKGVLAKLNPDALVDQIETSGALGSLFKGKKARYWEIYEKMYGEISDQAENDFHDLFSREFARAYKEQLDKLK